MKHHFERMLAYNQWANQRVFESLRSQNAPEAAWALFSHILRAEAVWLGRIQNKPFTGGAFGVLPVEELPKWMQDSGERFAAEISARHDFTDVFHYHTLDGTPAKSELGDILTHLFNHGTYHRAQIATRMREAGLQPVATDFIGFSRLRGDN